MDPGAACAVPRLDRRTPARVLYRLAAYTGARRGEILNLRWPALDLDAGEVAFTGSTAVIDGERVEDTTKGDRSRVVSLDAGTVAAAREHRKQQLAERLAAGPHWAGTDHVFTTETGEAIFPDTVS
jgi:integrase